MPGHPVERGAINSFFQMRKLRPREVVFPRQGETDGGGGVGVEGQSWPLAQLFGVCQGLESPGPLPSRLISASRGEDSRNMLKGALWICSIPVWSAQLA